jgi:hypothetical protein
MEGYNPERLVPTMEHEGGSVMVWATILCYNVVFVPVLLVMA